MTNFDSVLPEAGSAGDIKTKHESESEEHVPYVTHNEYPELTLRAGLLAGILSLILGSANVYLGLLVGMTISASIPASVISMSFLKLLGGSNILENNIVQTGGSAGSSVASGTLFTIPALVIFNVKKNQGDPTFAGVEGWDSFLGMHYFYVTALAMLGGILGIMWSIPIRRAMLLEIKPRLAYPEGVATAEVLKSGEHSSSGLKAVLSGALVGFLSKMTATMNLYKATFGFGWLYKNMYPAYYAFNCGASLVGVGYIIGPYIGLVLVMGSLSQWMIIIPISAAINGRWDESQWDPANGPFTALNVANAEFQECRYIGVGLMILGGLNAVFSLRRALVQSIKFGLKQFKVSRDKSITAVETPRTERDIPFHIAMGCALCAIVVLYFVFSMFSDQWGWCVLIAIFTCFISFLFASVSAYMAGLVGTSNNPTSGITICCAMAISGLVLLFFGKDDPLGPPTVILVCCSVAVACSIAGDNMQDLKSGHILGATPWKQELVMVIGVCFPALCMAPILELLHKAYVLGEGLEAPQASIIAAIPVGIANGTLPYVYIGIGIGLGVVIVILDKILARYETKFRLPVLAFAVAIYLPSQYISTIFLGSLIPVFFKPKTTGAVSEGVLVAAGLVTGDALTGILTAIPIAALGDSTVMHVITTAPGWPVAFPFILILAVQAYCAKYEPFTRQQDNLEVLP
uniref:Oligopeptide transporter n=1 Tax=Mucochytrium quahogii TaxID=96639 RepID=A0A7S2RDU4_9STRA|mmetsp:Transcript_11826/g.19260  ORF Transcript_11826/g.19260 Transcript_11826/m.19260 type:complete len:689 (-) Transcript_11826:165-2231(-)